MKINYVIHYINLKRFDFITNKYTLNLIFICCSLIMLSSCANNEEALNVIPLEENQKVEVDTEEENITKIIESNNEINEITENEEINSEDIDETELEEEINIYEGEWQRTNVENNSPSTIVISNYEDDSFDFSVAASYFSHTGTFDGRVEDGGEKITIYIGDDITFDEIDIKFTFDKEKLVIETEGYLPVGMGVTIDGEYTKSDPLYTNEKYYKEIIPNYFFENAILNFQYAIDGNEFWDIINPIKNGYINKIPINNAILYEANTATLGGLKTYTATEENYIYFWYYSYPNSYMFTNNKNFENSSVYNEAKEHIEEEFVDVFVELYLVGKNKYDYEDKALYLNSLNYIKSYEDKNTFKDKHSMKQLYEYWDIELNRIYELLKFKLTEEEFSKLKEEQINWVNNKYELEENLKADEDLSSEESEYYIYENLLEYTKTKTYKLINICFEKN